MVITITTYGTSLRKNNGCIEITEPNGKVHTFPPHEVSALVFSVPCKFTSEIVSLCMEHDIYITMTDRRGVPLWHIEPFEGGSVPLLRRKQLLLSERQEGGRTRRNDCRLPPDAAGLRGYRGASLFFCAGHTAPS